MKRLSFMVVAGEASGDTLAAELVEALRREVLGEGEPRRGTETDSPSPLPSPPEEGAVAGSGEAAGAVREPVFAPEFFGAGGARMAAAGVEVLIQMTDHAVIGISDVIRKLAHFRRMLRQLVAVTEERQPDVIVCVDFSGFNRRFAQAIRRRLRARSAVFSNWKPRIVQYVSPQVWASREGRVHSMPGAYDLLLSIFPFEKGWYAARVPEFPVEFVGHPIVDRHPARAPARGGSTPEIILLPGSRPGEVKRHLPVLLEAAKRILAEVSVKFTMVLPSEVLASQARKACGSLPATEVQVGGLERVLPRATLALTKSGTITLECAVFGVPAVVFYITSLPNYWIGRKIVKVKYLAMPNLLADEPLFPEFIQAEATPENISRAALDLLRDEEQARVTREKLARVVASLGTGGGSRRAAMAILKLLNTPQAYGNRSTR